MLIVSRVAGVLIRIKNKEKKESVMKLVNVNKKKSTRWYEYF